MKSAESKQIFAALGGKARFVGGCVRDFLLGKDISDVDIATPLLPDEVISRLKQSDIRVIPTGLKHGTVTAVINKQNFEITTLRRDVACDGRHAEVEFTDDWEEDAARRDFTVNAMSMDAGGEVYDYFGGQEDLKSGVIRFVGNAEDRCAEDVLRILRFFRFNAYYGKFPVDASGLAACVKLADKIPELSGERMQAEMFKLLLAPNVVDALQVMDEVINRYIFPCQVSIEVFERLLGLGEDMSVQLRLAALLRNSDEGQLQKLIKGWKLSNKDKKLLYGLLFPEVQFSFDMDLADRHRLIRRLGVDNFCMLVLLGAAVSGDGDYKGIIKEAKGWEIPVFPLGGKDLQDIGIKPGVRLGEYLRKAEEYWEEGGYKLSKEELIEFVKTLR